MSSADHLWEKGNEKKVSLQVLCLFSRLSFSFHYLFLDGLRSEGERRENEELRSGSFRFLFFFLPFWPLSGADPFWRQTQPWAHISLQRTILWRSRDRRLVSLSFRLSLTTSLSKNGRVALRWRERDVSAYRPRLQKMWKIKDNNK